MFVSTDARATVNLVTLGGEVRMRGGRWIHVKTSAVITKEELAIWLVKTISDGYVVCESYSQHRASLVVYKPNSAQIAYLIHTQAR